MSPIVDKVAHDFVDITFAKLDADDNPETMRKYKLRSVPSFLLFKDGEKVGEIIGSMNEAKFIEKIFQYW